MAEQIGHNVVNKPLSTSGSPLVDAALNSTTTQPAPTSGTQPQSSTTISTTGSLDPSKIAANSATQKDPAGSDGAVSAAEPSAGDAALKPNDELVSTPANPIKDKTAFSHGDILNDVRDDASQGEGPADDKSIAEMSVDVSVSSDTDNSRADAAEKKDGNHHSRTNSVKKPAAFSKVTATKNFMNKIAPAAPVVPKVGEKPSPVTLSTALTSKPRLVAKTGATAGIMQKSRPGNEAAGGPDANKVWNKNRPVAPPPPRQFTDEELKQQYGIHLATRLQTDEAGKESKWADIDDDEDDWAPETVVWMDGTKSSLTPQDAVPPVPPPSEQKPQQQDPQTTATQPVKPTEGVRPTLSIKQRSDVKILKPGAAAAQIKQDVSPAPEKQLLKAKAPPQAPAPAPAKSPWAPVPKVESVSPVNPPIQQPPPARVLPSQDARTYEASAPSAAREIAADTFDRSWREGEGGTRELFNSTNGRYEPAPDGRRGSVKPEPMFRKPAVLQRPQQNGLNHAEPSAAFQSRTAVQMDGSWGRRRGSSISQGSIPPARRMSVNQRAEIPPAMKSPHSARGEPVKPVFAQQSAWDQQMPPQPESGAADDTPTAPAEPAEDPVKVQERVMREKRELAVKRRKEEEEREEVAKQERLKAKLAALEGAGKSKKEREAEAAAAAAAAVTATATKDAPAAEDPATETAAPASSAATANIAQQSEPPKPAETSATVAPSLEAQSLPPPPVQKPSLPLDRRPAHLPPKPPAVATPDSAVNNIDPQQRQVPRPPFSPHAGARVPYQQSAPHKTPASSYSSPGDRKLQPSFGRSPNLANDTFTPWPTTAPNSNVWGTSGIGNGTFESTSSFAPIQSSSLPPPPGMTRPGNASTRISPQGFGQETRSPNLQQQQMAEQQRAFQPPGIDFEPDTFPAQSRLNGTSPVPGLGRPAQLPTPIGPPSRMQTQQQPMPPRPNAIAAWNQAAQSLPNQYRDDIKMAEEKRRQETSMPAQPPAERTYRETFKKTVLGGKLGAPRKYESTEYTIHDADGSHAVSSLSPAPPSTQTQPSAPFPTASPLQQGHWKSAPENQVRIPDPSRNPAHGGMAVQQAPIAPPVTQQPSLAAYQGNSKFPTPPIAPITESKDQSPPPPETDDHPVNEGDHHPHVKLPRPQAKVKLPPTSPSGVASVPLQQNNGSVLMPQRQYSAWGTSGARPLVQNHAWQARFNGLFNRTAVHTETPPSPPKTPPKMQGPAPAVSSSSRAAMDVQAADVTVSLPHAKKRFSSEGFIVDDSFDHVSKTTTDYLFNEERSFGSMPRVHVPRKVKYNISTTQSNGKVHFPNSKLHKQVVDLETRQEPFFWKHPEGIFLTIPNTRFRNRLVRRADKQNGGYYKKTNGNKEPEHQERRPIGRLPRSKGGKDTSASDSAATGTPNNDGSRKSGYQKPSRQPSTPGTAAEGTSDSTKTEGANEDKRKAHWGRGARGGRNNAATPAASTAVKAA